MPKPKLIDRPRRLEIHVPDSIHAKARAQLYSEIEGRVPHGAWSELIEDLLIEWLRSRGVAV